MKPFSLMFDEVTPESLIKFHIDDITDCDNSNDVNQPGWNIHAPIHRARPDIIFAAHTHTTEIVAVSCNKEGLLPISQYSSIIGARLSYHAYSGIVSEHTEGKQIAENLGQSTFMLMRNHGSMVVGDSAPLVLFNQYMLQRACDVQCKTDINNTTPIVNVSNEKPSNYVSAISPPDMLWNALKRKI